jgi:hypothetical protein
MRHHRLFAFVIAAMLILAACSGGDTASFDGGDARDTSAPTTTIVPGFDDGEGFENTGAPGEADTDAGATNAQSVVDTAEALNLGRKIIYTAYIEIEVDDVLAAGAEVEAAINGLGGILFGQETTTGERPRSILTIKIAPERFDDALARLGGVGELISQRVTADDVTERVVDLESRIATAEVSVERLRTLLEAATGIEDIVELETELLQRETDLEVLRGQLRTLEDAVSLATIIVVLTEPEPDVPEPMLEVTQTLYSGLDGGERCPGAEELTIDEDEPFTVCFEILNTGDTAMADIEIRDWGLDMDEDDVLVVDGDLTAPLQPGQRLILAFETEADPEHYTAVDVSATPVDESGDPLRVGYATDVTEAFLDVIPDDSLPGFMDALEAAWGTFMKFVGVLVLAAGAVIPWLWVPVLGGAFWWWRKRHSGPEID